MPKSLNILVVDDIFTNRMLYCKIIKNLGHQCIEATDGKKAIELITKNNIDIVLMDIEMPVMNGIDATIYIRKKLLSPYNKIPVFALSAHEEEIIKEKNNNYSLFNGFISKPITIEKLQQLLAPFTE